MNDEIEYDMYTRESGDSGGAHKTEQISLLIDYLNLMNEIFFSPFSSLIHTFVYIFYFISHCFALDLKTHGTRKNEDLQTV